MRPGIERWRTTAVLVATGLAAAVVAARPRFGQNPAYHAFADQRPLLGIPNALDVLSNLGFALVGLAGIAAALRATYVDPRERAPWLVAFAGVALTCAGSAFYHLAPDDGRLLWDRLPMTIVFMGLVTALVAERIDVGLARGLLAPLVLAGMGTVVYWAVTESRGAGDLRPYVLAQAAPIVAAPLLVGLFPARYDRGGAWLVAVALYGLAKLAELLDGEILAAAGASGHTLKHLLAAAAVGALVLMLRRRAPVG